MTTRMSILSGSSKSSYSCLTLKLYAVLITFSVGSHNHDRFFSAIPPTLRAKWGESMNRLVAPGGYLITLAFPVRYEFH